MPAATSLKGFIQQAEALEGQRLPLRSAVQKGIFELREELAQMNGRLRSHFSSDFIDSLYPELDSKGTTVKDEQDEDDDTSTAVDEIAVPVEGASTPTDNTSTPTGG